MSYLVWHCYKCESIHVDSFTFNSHELTTSNFFLPLSQLDSTFDSVTSSCFSPIHTSSPRPITSWHSINRAPSATKTPSTRSKSGHGFPPKQANLRLLTVNCCSIRINRAEFHTALDYVKPDLVCGGTGSWLKGVKQVHRNDRSLCIVGGVFTATSTNLASDAQPQLTNHS